jgi:hypothetical protein
MSVVVPKLFYSKQTGSNIPVWEIVSKNGHHIYYERFHYKGLVPIGVRENFQYGGSTFRVCETVKIHNNKPPVILKAKDGYVAPMSWYEDELSRNQKDMDIITTDEIDEYDENTTVDVYSSFVDENDDRT